MGVYCEKHGHLRPCATCMWNAMKSKPAEPTAEPAGSGPCKTQCEAAAFRAEIKRMRSEMIASAAFLACELLDDDIPEANAERLRKRVVLKLRSIALDGPSL